jgi:hypothetical protein|eukprot:jgi/Chrpa1/23641/Chrysochromulina_OHIO_Genome00027396-RA
MVRLFAKAATPEQTAGLIKIPEGKGQGRGQGRGASRGKGGRGRGEGGRGRGRQGGRAQGDPEMATVLAELESLKRRLADHVGGDL